MYKPKKFLKIAAAALVASVLLAAGGGYRKKPAVQTDICKIEKYQNLQIPISRQKTYSGQEVENLSRTIRMELGNPASEEDYLRCTDGRCRSEKEFLQLVQSALLEEQRYEAELEKREGVLRAVLRESTFSGETDDREETVLLAIYEQEGLKLTKKEIDAGSTQLQQVFGAASLAELSCFLAEEEQLRIIKKEKTYEYLLENNHFVTVADLPVSGERSGGGISCFGRMCGGMDG